MTSPGRRTDRWVRVAFLVVAVAALLPLKRAISAFRDEYAVFRSTNHVVVRPAADAQLPAITDVVIDVPGRPQVAAWHVASRNGAAVLLVHGSGGDRASLWPEARELARSGFGIMLIDMPGHGESRGDVDWGAGGRAAVSAALAWLVAQPDVDGGRVGALGFSMGAAQVTQVAAGDQRIRAVILAGCYSDAHQQTLFEYGSWGPITGWPAVWAYRAAGFDDSDQRPVDVIAHLAPRPLLIVHGTNDNVVPPAMASELHVAAGATGELWLVPGARHGDYMQAAPELWRQRLVDFFSGSLLHPTSPRDATLAGQ